MTEERTYATAPRDDAYDCIVVGSGLGGLSAAAFLAKAGKKVLVLERLDGPGGYAHSFKRGPYTFDPAVHAMGQARPGLMLDTWLRILGVREECNLIDLDRFYTVFFPDYRFDAPFGFDEFVDAHAREFPQAEKGFRAFMDLARQIMKEAAPEAVIEAASRDAFQTILEYRTATVGDVLDQHVDDERLKAVVTALWGYQGVPPSRLPFVMWAGMAISLLEGGQCYCEGSFQNLVDCYVRAIERDGGEVVVRNQVTKVLVEEGHVQGVVLAEGQEVTAPVVLSNADLMQTIDELVGAEHFPSNYVRRIRGLTAGISAFIVYTASTLDFGQFGSAHEIFLFKHWSHDEGWAQIQAGEPSAYMIAVPTLEDPSLAPPGEHTVIAAAMMPFDLGRPWRELKDQYTERVLDDLESVFPGFRDGLTFAEGATPQALYGYSLSQNGAMYGWENTPRQTHSRRPSNQTPLAGLYLAGAWAQPGSGTIGALQSGFRTAQMILGYGDRNEFLAALGSVEGPAHGPS